STNKTCVSLVARDLCAGLTANYRLGRLPLALGTSRPVSIAKIRPLVSAAPALADRDERARQPRVTVDAGRAHIVPCRQALVLRIDVAVHALVGERFAFGDRHLSRPRGRPPQRLAGRRRDCGRSRELTRTG